MFRCCMPESSGVYEKEEMSPAVAEARQQLCIKYAAKGSLSATTVDEVLRSCLPPTKLDRYSTYIEVINFKIFTRRSYDCW